MCYIHTPGRECPACGQLIILCPSREAHQPEENAHQGVAAWSSAGGPVSKQLQRWL